MVCEYCGKEIDINNIYGKGRFCNRKCQLASVSKKGSLVANNNKKEKFQQKLKIKKCLFCGKEFKTIIGKFCSRECSGKFSGNKSRVFSEESKKKTSESLKKYFSEHKSFNKTEKEKRSYKKRNKFCKKEEKHCKLCGKYLSEKGYKVYRIKWNEISTDSGKLKMKDKIEKFLSFYSSL